jgi:hypothetical protein
MAHWAAEQHETAALCSIVWLFVCKTLAAGNMLRVLDSGSSAATPITTPDAAALFTLPAHCPPLSAFTAAQSAMLHCCNKRTAI